ncbi:MAG TPA: metalloregulator ArsR/SmtB family transcription factor [Actinomycetes bacterium]|nr:metalloregulator ArsR/SmtB family transcription factor [Actinomycetes bacterium]
MVERLAEMDAVFHALAHPARREMLDRLAGGEHSVGELAAPFQMSLAAASKHVKVLEEAGLLHRAVRGRRHLCRLAPERLAEASAWLRFYERFWSERLDRLDAMFRPTGDPEEEGPCVPTPSG